MEFLYFGLQTMAIGFTLVLTVLFVLNLLIVLFSRLVAFRSNTSRSSAIMPVVDESDSGVESVRARQKIVAAISAAIDSYLNSEDGMADYRITRVEPHHGNFSSQWALQGREDLLKMNLILTNIRREKFGQKII